MPPVQTRHALSPTRAQKTQTTSEKKHALSPTRAQKILTTSEKNHKKN